MSIDVNGTTFESESEFKLSQMYDKMVPPIGAADTVAGEIVRAVSHIGGRYVNDGDCINCAYGKETCNPPARYLGMNTDNEIKEILRAMGDVFSAGEYEEGLYALYDAVYAYLKANPELQDMKNEEDMYDYTVKEEDRNDLWDDDDDGERWD